MSRPTPPCRLSTEPCLPRYKDKVTDHNFGSLIRMDADEEYSESNTIFGAFCATCSAPQLSSFIVMRVQFLAFEVNAALEIAVHV